MKKLLIFMFVLSVGTTQGQSFLHVVKTNDIVTDFALLTQEIHFSSTGNIEIHPVGGGSATIFTFNEIKELRFSDVATSIASPSAQEELLHCWVSGSDLWIRGSSDLLQLQKITLYTLSGNLVNQLTQSLSQPIVISDLPKGIYFINLNNQTLKFIKL